jgi:hypothetical protein
MNEEKKKIDFEFNVNKQLQEQFKNSKYIKYATVTATLVGLILAAGFASKVITYTIANIKTLSQTLKK